MKIIENAKNSNRLKHNGIYYENHHIIPKSLGGSNSEDNLVLLTAREHFFCHKILAKLYGGKMIFAYWRLCNSHHYKCTNTREYENVKLIFSAEMKKLHENFRYSFYDDVNWRFKSGSGRRGKVTTDEQKEKISNTLKLKYPEKQITYKYRRTDEDKKHKSENHWLKGKHQPLEVKIKGQITQSKGSVRCIETNKTFLSSREAANSNENWHHNCIIECCRGIRKSHNGFHFEFIEEVYNENYNTKPI